MVARDHSLGQDSRRSPVPVVVGFQAHLWLDMEHSDWIQDAQACNGGSGAWLTGDGLSSRRRGCCKVMESGAEDVEVLEWDAGIAPTLNILVVGFQMMEERRQERVILPLPGCFGTSWK